MHSEAAVFYGFYASFVRRHDVGVKVMKRVLAAIMGDYSVDGLLSES